jgi:multidrug resistance efflux pump
MFICLIIVLMPGVNGRSSLDGIVNGRFSIISSPIAGTVMYTSPKAGSVLKKDYILTEIQNHHVDRLNEKRLEAELNSAGQIINAIKTQREILEAMLVKLEKSRGNFQSETVKSLESQLARNHSDSDIRSAQLESATIDLKRKQNLVARKAESQSSLDIAQAIQKSSEGESAKSKTEIARSSQQLDAARHGIYVGAAQNDVPYTQQRSDEISIILADLTKQYSINSANQKKLENQLSFEEKHNIFLSNFRVEMPFDGVIWSNDVVQGANIATGQELMRVLDCREIFVDILVTSVDDEIIPGQKVEIRVFGRDKIVPGTVLFVLGSASNLKSTDLAADLPRGEGKNTQIRVSFNDKNIQTDYNNFCQVGRRAQVRIHTNNIHFVRWIKSLWYSIF